MLPEQIWRAFDGYFLRFIYQHFKWSRPFSLTPPNSLLSPIITGRNISDNMDCDICWAQKILTNYCVIFTKYLALNILQKQGFVEI